jgi:hypothetical protein
VPQRAAGGFSATPAVTVSSCRAAQAPSPPESFTVGRAAAAACTARAGRAHRRHHQPGSSSRFLSDSESVLAAADSESLSRATVPNR